MYYVFVYIHAVIVEISPGNVTVSSGDVVNVTCTATLDSSATFVDIVWRVNMTAVNASTDVISATENGSLVYTQVLPIGDEYSNVPITCLVYYNESESKMSSPIFITVTGKLEKCLCV